MFHLIREPWPWYVAGVLVGLTVPALLLLGNKSFGISSSLRHICAACLPAGIPFFQYNWRKEVWNLFFVAGIALGGFIATQWLNNPEPVHVAEPTAQALQHLGVIVDGNLMPASIFSFSNLFYPKRPGVLCNRWLPHRLRNAVCGRLYKRACYHGAIDPAMAFARGYGLFYGGRLFYGSRRFSVAVARTLTFNTNL